MENKKECCYYVCPNCTVMHEEEIDSCPECGATVGTDDVFKSEWKVSCQVCGGTSFYFRRTLMNTRGLTFFGADWISETALNYICRRCGFIHWFIDVGDDAASGEVLEEGSLENEGLLDRGERSSAMPDECPACFHKRSLGDTECANCGHRFSD